MLCAAEGGGSRLLWGAAQGPPALQAVGLRADGPPLPTVLTAHNAERHCKAETARHKSLQLPAQHILKQDNPSRGTLESMAGESWRGVAGRQGAESLPHVGPAVGHTLPWC